MNNTAAVQTSPIKLKYQSARANLLLMIILTAVNVFLILSGSESMMLFSATVPYLAVIMGMATQMDIMVIVAVCFAAAIILIYLLCWVMSKRHYGWMMAALVMFAIDTVVMALMYFYIGEVSGVLDIGIHAWVLYYLFSGVANGKKLHNAPEEEDEPLVVTDYETTEPQDSSNEEM